MRKKSVRTNASDKKKPRTQSKSNMPTKIRMSSHSGGGGVRWNAQIQPMSALRRLARMLLKNSKNSVHPSTVNREEPPIHPEAVMQTLHLPTPGEGPRRAQTHQQEVTHRPLRSHSSSRSRTRSDSPLNPYYVTSTRRLSHADDPSPSRMMANTSAQSDRTSHRSFASSSYSSTRSIPQEDHKTCVICYDEDNTTNATITLPCQHMYHKDCLRNHIEARTYPVCPICKRRIPKKVIVSIGMNQDLDAKIIKKMLTKIISKLYHKLYINDEDQIVPMSDDNVNDNTIKISAYKYYELKAFRKPTKLVHTKFVISKYSDESKKTKIVTYSGNLYPLVPLDGTDIRAINGIKLVPQLFYANIACESFEYKKTVLNLSVNFEAMYSCRVGYDGDFIFENLDQNTFVIKENV